MEVTSSAKAMETLLRLCSHNNNNNTQENLNRLLYLQQIAEERVSNVDEEIEEEEEIGKEGIYAVNEVFSHIIQEDKVSNYNKMNCISSPSLFTIGVKELCEVFPSWCRNTEIDRQEQKQKQQEKDNKNNIYISKHSFICCAWNSAYISSELTCLGSRKSNIVYQSPWSNEYQLPLSILNTSSNNNNTIVKQLKKEAKEIEEAYKCGKLIETIKYESSDAFIREFQQRLNYALETYVIQYLPISCGILIEENENSFNNCLWAASAFIRNIPLDNNLQNLDIIILEVIVIVCIDIPVEYTQSKVSLFDSELEIKTENNENCNVCSIEITNNKSTVKKSSKRRWTAGHVFQLKFNNNDNKLNLRHDSSHIVTNIHKSSQENNNSLCSSNGFDRINLFPKHQGRPESLPLPKRNIIQGEIYSDSGNNNNNSVENLLKTLNLETLVNIICERVEKIDNAVTLHGVSPIVKVTLPLIAPSPQQVWDKVLRKRSNFVATAGKAIAAMAADKLKES